MSLFKMTVMSTPTSRRSTTSLLVFSLPAVTRALVNNGRAMEIFIIFTNSNFKKSPHCASRNAFSLATAFDRWELAYFESLSISAYVLSDPSGWKQGAKGKPEWPLGGTIRPRWTPWKMWIGFPRPWQYAKVTTAEAESALGPNPVSILPIS